MKNLLTIKTTVTFSIETMLNGVNLSSTLHDTQMECHQLFFKLPHVKKYICADKRHYSIKIDIRVTGCEDGRMEKAPEHLLF
jgi:hypothetical protein